MFQATTTGMSPPGVIAKANPMKSNTFEIANIGGGDMIVGGSDFGI